MARRSQKFEFVRDLETDCWNLTSHAITKQGYPKVCINQRHRYAAHHFYELVYGPLPFGTVIRHTCDNPQCINPAHLQAGTHADNVADRVERGRSAIGTNHGRAELTERQVKNIRGLLDTGLTRTEIARKYGVTRRVIYQIAEGLTWKHV